MRIGYDGMPFTLHHVEGMLVYNNQLLRELVSRYPDHEYYYFFNSLRQGFRDTILPGSSGNAHRVVMPLPSVLPDRAHLRLYFDVALPLWQWKKRIDVFHGLRYFVPPKGKTKVVVTFHDLFAHVVPETMPPKIIQVRLEWYRKAVERSDRIIASSQTTKQDLLRFYRIPEDKIDVVHLAPDPVYRLAVDQAARQRVISTHNLDRSFLLALGSNPVRKNSRRILQAFSIAVNRGLHDHDLVFFGSSTRLSAEWSAMVNEFNLGNKVKLVGAIPNEDLPALYSLASVFVYPSLYEGFGIPILEAMTCGAPVITSRISATAEVADDAALLVDPRDADAIADGMCRLCLEESFRQEIVGRGSRRAAQFSWEKAAQQTMHVYTRVCTR